MPIYDYRCDKCEQLWEENLSMGDRDKPCKKKCPFCEEKGHVKKHVGGFPSMAVDTTMNANTKTGGRWNEIMNRIQSKTPDRYKDNLNHNMTGRKWRS